MPSVCALCKVRTHARARTCTRVPAWMRARADLCNNGGVQMPKHVMSRASRREDCKRMALLALFSLFYVGSGGAPGNIESGCLRNESCCLFLRVPKRTRECMPKLSVAFRAPFLKCPLSRPLSTYLIISLSISLSLFYLSLSLGPGKRGHPPPRTARSCSNTACTPRHSWAHCPTRGYCGSYGESFTRALGGAADAPLCLTLNLMPNTNPYA